MGKPIFEVSLQWYTNKVGFQLGGRLECDFNMIFSYESNWSPLMIISGILLCGIEGSYVPFNLVVDPCDHGIHFNI